MKGDEAAESPTGEREKGGRRPREKQLGDYSLIVNRREDVGSERDHRG